LKQKKAGEVDRNGKYFGLGKRGEYPILGEFIQSYPRQAVFPFER
jgi:hypothetical protein